MKAPLSEMNNILDKCSEKLFKNIFKKKHILLFNVEGVGILEGLLDLYLAMELAH